MLFKQLLLASTATATCLHGLRKFKRQEGEAAVEIKNFSYTGLTGPLNWPSLDPANEACKTGKNQSPISIDSKVITAAVKDLKLDIPDVPVEYENLGTTIEVIVNGTTTFEGNDFRLLQFHKHSPSEHRIDDEYFPLEIHMVHEGVADPTQLAVISVLFELSEEAQDPLLSSIAPHIAAISEPGTKTEIPRLDTQSLINHVQTTELFQYTGSLTTPPCAEGLTFLITKEPLKIDVATFNAIKSTVKFNSRYTQNTLGEENLITVAGVAGTAEQFNPPAPAEEEQAENEAPAAVTAGQTITITELHGEPTHIVGVVQKS